MKLLTISIFFIVLFPGWGYSMPKFETCTSPDCPTLEDVESKFSEVLDELSGLNRLIERIGTISISDEFVGSAITISLPDQTGAVDKHNIILSTNTFKNALDLEKFLEWKEHMAFRGFHNLDLPLYDVDVPSSYPTLYYVTLHEIGHVAYHEFEANYIECRYPEIDKLPFFPAAVQIEKFVKENEIGYENLDCNYSDDSFNLHSWIDMKFDHIGLVERRLPNQNHALLDKICFYGCQGQSNWLQSEIYELYSFLSSSSFTSLYSAYAKPGEDFAESFTYYYLSNFGKKAKFQIYFKSGLKLDLIKKVDTSNFLDKREFMMKIFSHL